MPNSSSSLDFENTEIAFQTRTNAALQKARLLFKSFGSNFLVDAGPKLIRFAFKLNLPIDPLIRNTIFEHFCGGETMEEAYQQTVLPLLEHKIDSILDYSVEGVKTEEGFNGAQAEIARIIEFSKDKDGIPFIVFKITAMGSFETLEKVASGKKLSTVEKKAYDLVKGRLHSLCAAASKAGLRVMIDAEESWIQDPIDEMVLKVMEEFNGEGPLVYNTVQMYRHDRLEYLKKTHSYLKSKDACLGVKLVRGAYMEKERVRAEENGYPSPIQPSKEATDKDYDLALEFCVDNIDSVGLCAGTHNESSMKKLSQLMKAKGISPGDPRIECSQLLGMSDNLSFNMAHHGFNVSKYVPYGPIKAVMPYLFRRAEENTSIKGQSGRELQLIQTELKRRRAL